MCLQVTPSDTKTGDRNKEKKQVKGQAGGGVKEVSAFSLYKLTAMPWSR